MVGYLLPIKKRKKEKKLTGYIVSWICEIGNLAYISCMITLYAGFD